MCIICDSYVRPAAIVRVCDECNYGKAAGKCLICNYTGTSDAYYCKECALQEKDRDGCPKIVNMVSSLQLKGANRCGRAAQKLTLTLTRRSMEPVKHISLLVLILLFVEHPPPSPQIK